MAKILVFGDSNASDELYLGSDCWVTKLRNFFSSEEETLVFNLGIVGDTSKNLLKRIDNECKAREPDIILIEIGTNDSRYNNITADSVETSLDIFEENIQKLIFICGKYTSKIIFIGNTPANESKTTPTIWSKTEYFLNKSMKKYDDVIKRVSKKK